MSWQRRRGQSARVYRTHTITDGRGNPTVVVNEADWIDVTAVFIPDRSARAEVPGQQQVNVFKMIVGTEIGDVGLWGRVHWDGKRWDVVSPPALHHGTRNTRHYSLTIRQRP